VIGLDTNASEKHIITSRDMGRAVHPLPPSTQKKEVEISCSTFEGISGKPSGH